MMRLLDVLLVFMVALLASCDGADTPTKNQLTISITDAGATAKALQKLFAEDAKKSKNNGYLKVINDSVVPGEERAGGGGQGPRAGAGTSVVSGGSGSSQTVTVTTYNNNGLWQRFLRWWHRLLHGSSRRN
ncbi:unnamed protein product [Phytophthora fragariaefolia]|uniref:Unnamed protein product n=1 Tax=Phytophthora fragariaefolia TaxID=1490495 RepID=A0A9W6X8Q8_9STRA|nr:unnamed protein product [Phytophthora fragariaefolia]